MIRSLLNRLRPEIASGNASPSSPLDGLTRALLVDWRDNDASFALVTRSLTTDPWRIEREFEIEWPTEVEVGKSAITKGERVRRALTKHSVDVKHVVVAVPRRQAIVKLFELEAVSPESLTDAVLLQAEMRGHSSENYVIDYVSHLNTADAPSYALTVAYPKDFIADVQTAMKDAGLVLRHIGIGELCLAGISSPRADSPIHLAILQEGDSFTFVAALNRRPLSLLNVRRSVTGQSLEAFITTTIGRVLVAMPKSLLASGITTVYMMGEGAEQTVASLDQLQGRSFTHVRLPKSLALRSWLVGTDSHPDDSRVNFLRPKNSGDAKTLKRKRRVQWATRAALVATLALVCFQFLLSRWDASMERNQRELARLETTIESQTEIIETADKLAAWQTSQINWPEELSRFLGLLPDNSRVFLQRLRVEQPLDQPAEIRIEGFARSLDDAIGLKQRMLAKSPYYQMRPENIEKHDRNPHYPFGVIVSATLHSDSVAYDAAEGSHNRITNTSLTESQTSGVP